MCEAAKNRPRQVIYENDGDDCLVFPKNREKSIANWLDLRTSYLKNTEVDTVFYTPTEAGFGHVSLKIKNADPLMVKFGPEDNRVNLTPWLFEQGTDTLTEQIKYARENDLEIFVDVRMNDVHDVADRPGAPHILFPPFKRKHPELLGTGDPHGVAACETANNAATGGAMVPMLSMGIPGSNAAAMMMAALTIQGVQLGPMLLKAQPEYLGATFCSMFLANILMVFVSLIMAKGFARILSMPYWMLGTFILALAFTGCYASRNSMTSVYVMLAGSVLGYFLKKYHFNIPALILGLVLGPILERQFRRGMQMADSVGEFFSRPITLGILAIVVIMYTYAFIKMVRDHKAENA